MKKEIKKKKTKKKISIIYSILALIGIVVCTICDLGLNSELTWSIIVNSSITLGYLITIPLVNNGKKGILLSLIFLTIFIVPYLLILNNTLDVSESFLTIGISMYIILTIYLWIIYLLFKKLKNREFLWSSISWFLLIIITIIINLILHKMIDEPIIDIYDIIIFIVLLIVSISFLIIDLKTRNKFPPA